MGRLVSRASNHHLLVRWIAIISSSRSSLGCARTPRQCRKTYRPSARRLAPALRRHSRPHSTTLWSPRLPLLATAQPRRMQCNRDKLCIPNRAALILTARMDIVRSPITPSFCADARIRQGSATMIDGRRKYERGWCEYAIVVDGTVRTHRDTGEAALAAAVC